MNQNNVICLNKTGYDSFIDFLKAYCIFVVVFCHGFPYLKEIGYAVWGVQIPLFLLIQVFHSYKREQKPINWKMILRRILLPFIVVEMFVLVAQALNGGGQNVCYLLKEFVRNGGFGPGSYYPWIYIQMVVLIPLMRPICEKLTKWKSLLIFFLICELIEIICSVTNFPDSVYRLLCLRYLMLIWIGYMWVKEGIRFNFVTIIASLLSLGIILWLSYYRGGYEPWLFTTDWTTHRWMCYFWAGIFFTGLLYLLFSKVARFFIVQKCVKALASASYEIFLIQMVYYALISLRRFDFVGNIIVQFLLWFALAFIVSIVGGLGLYKLEKSY